MLDALVAAAFRKLGAACDKVDLKGGDPAEALQAGMLGYIRLGLSNPDEYRTAFSLRTAC